MMINNVASCKSNGLNNHHRHHSNRFHFIKSLFLLFIIFSLFKVSQADDSLKNDKIDATNQKNVNTVKEQQTATQAPVKTVNPKSENVNVKPEEATATTVKPVVPTVSSTKTATAASASTTLTPQKTVALTTLAATTTTTATTTTSAPTTTFANKVQFTTEASLDKQIPTPPLEVSGTAGHVRPPSPTTLSSTDEAILNAEKDYEVGISKLNGTKGSKDYKSAYLYLKKAADAGHLKAREEVAFAHLFGNYLNRNVTLARALFEELAVKGSARAQFGLGFLHSSGLSVKSNQAKSLVYFTFGALGGDPTAQMALGYRYWSGVSVDASCEIALNYYRKVATHVASQINPNSAGTIVHRIRLYDEDENLITQNQALLDDDLVQYYQLLADRGDTQAQYGLGLLHYQGGRGEMQYNLALHYFSRAAEAGNYYAMAYLGKMYLEGGPYVTQNNQTAFRYFKLAAEKGNPIGQAGLGMMYFYGSGIEKDYSKALKYFQQSAEQGYVEGHFLLGIMYYYGYGIRKDYKMAVKYFNLAAQLGHVLAYFNLAQMYATGTGAIRSCQTACELYKNVAERGRWSNMFMEAHSSYKEGDLEKALVKYIYLAELGYEVAQSNVAYILDQFQTKLFSSSDSYKRALLYWNRAATQGYQIARLKLGDYYYYGYGTEIDYQQAASHYKYASEISHNAQAMFNLAYMHEKGLGLRRDIHLAKRFYDLASETSPDAYLPVKLALIKLNLLFYMEFLENKYENIFHQFSLFESDWDVYLMFVIAILIAVVYASRRRHV